MDTQKFTKKSLEAVNNAQTHALERHNQSIMPEHITYALLADDEGLIPKLLTKCGVDAPQLLRETD
ncbi:MAG: Clp protease N-terminal domain-containing protein, partial [Clostridia bacterium]|nr:Clp protease N-terminal domain-containing protein [Clostridia bacterium]